MAGGCWGVGCGIAAGCCGVGCGVVGGGGVFGVAIGLAGEGWVEEEEGIGAINGDGRILEVKAVSTQCDMQMMHYRMARLTYAIVLMNVTQISLIKIRKKWVY